MKKALTNARSLTAALIAFGSLAGGANAAILMTITDDGTDLTMTATGSYDFTAADVFFNSAGRLGANAVVAPASQGIFGWETDQSAQTFIVSSSGSLTATSDAFGADSVTTSNPFYFDGFGSAIVFRAGADLVGIVNETAIFQNTTLASLGMVAGENLTLTWTGDSATIQVSAVPEPSSALLLALGSLSIAFRRSRR